MSVTRELQRRLSVSWFVSRFEPCLPRPAKQPPAGPGWIHEIKHDVFRIVAHRDTGGVRLIGGGFEFRMGNILAFAIVGALFALTPVATFAQSLPGPAGPVTASPKSGWSIIEDKSAIGSSMMRIRLLSIALVLGVFATADAGCLTEPRAWSRRDGRRMDLSRYRQDTYTCREVASVLRFSGDYRPWISRFVGCMRGHGYTPLYDDGTFC